MLAVIGSALEQPSIDVDGADHVPQLVESQGQVPQRVTMTGFDRQRAAPLGGRGGDIADFAQGDAAVVGDVGTLRPERCRWPINRAAARLSPFNDWMAPIKMPSRTSPASFILKIASRVSSGVALGVTATCTSLLAA